MSTLHFDDIRAAAERLRGQVVVTRTVAPASQPISLKRNAPCGATRPGGGVAASKAVAAGSNWHSAPPSLPMLALAGPPAPLAGKVVPVNVLSSATMANACCCRAAGA